METQARSKAKTAEGAEQISQANVPPSSPFEKKHWGVLVGTTATATGTSKQQYVY